MSENITLYSTGGKIIFGREGFILHEIEISPPKIHAGIIGQHQVQTNQYQQMEGHMDH